MREWRGPSEVSTEHLPSDTTSTTLCSACHFSAKLDPTTLLLCQLDSSSSVTLSCEQIVSEDK